MAMIDRCYAAFGALFTGLESRVVRRANGNFSVPAPALTQSSQPSKTQ